MVMMRPMLLLLLLQVLWRAAEGLPDDWVRGQDGGCQILVSERIGDGGMFGAGYRPCDEVYGGARSFCTEEPTPAGGMSWRIPVSPELGWFVTAETGEFSGGGEPIDGCPEFRWRMPFTAAAARAQAGPRSRPDDVIWTAPGPGTYRVEGAFADGMSIIYYYGHDITVSEASASAGNVTAAAAAAASDVSTPVAAA
jgi:hypothetical protein